MRRHRWEGLTELLLNVVQVRRVNWQLLLSAEHWLNWRWEMSTGFNGKKSKISRMSSQTTLYCRRKNIKRCDVEYLPFLHTHTHRFIVYGSPEAGST